MLKQGKGTDIHAAPVPRQRTAQKGAIRAKDGQRLDALKRLHPLDQKDVQTRDGIRWGAARLDPVNHIHQERVRKLEGVLGMLGQGFGEIQGLGPNSVDLMIPFMPVAPPFKA
jgi:hypothetical protein